MTGDTSNLTNDVVYKGVEVAIRLLRQVSHDDPDYADYRDSALSWVALAHERLSP